MGQKIACSHLSANDVQLLIVPVGLVTFTIFRTYLSSLGLVV